MFSIKFNVVGLVFLAAVASAASRPTHGRCEVCSRLAVGGQARVLRDTKSNSGSLKKNDMVTVIKLHMSVATGRTADVEISTGFDKKVTHRGVDTEDLIALGPVLCQLGSKSICENCCDMDGEAYSEYWDDGPGNVLYRHPLNAQSFHGSPEFGSHRKTWSNKCIGDQCNGKGLVLGWWAERHYEYCHVCRKYRYQHAMPWEAAGCEGTKIPKSYRVAECPSGSTYDIYETCQRNPCDGKITGTWRAKGYKFCEKCRIDCHKNGIAWQPKTSVVRIPIPESYGPAPQVVPRPS